MRASTKEKRTKILEVATKLFIEQGYKNTSLDQIVAICGGSKQTLYRYFSNKEGLFIEVLTHNIKDSVESVFQLSEKNNEPLQITLECFALNYLKGLCTNPLLGLFRIISADFNKHYLVSQQFWQTAPIRIHQYLIDFFQTSKACQSLQMDDADLACNQLLSLIKLDYHTKALLGLELPDDKELQQHVEKAVTTFLTLYQRR